MHALILRVQITGTVADGAPIIPISAQLRYNIDAINEYIISKIPVPPRDYVSSPELIVIRSFDVNKPGTEVSELKGGIAGGSILKGVLRLGDEIEIRPGVVSRDAQGKVNCRPLKSRIVTLNTESNQLQFATPGGLIGMFAVLSWAQRGAPPSFQACQSLPLPHLRTGVGTKVDPSVCRGDRLVGQVLGFPGNLPSIYTELEINYFLLRRLLGVSMSGGRAAKVSRLAKDEILMVNIGSTSTGGRVLSVKEDLAKIVLTGPCCTSVDERIALSRRIENHWR